MIDIDENIAISKTLPGEFYKSEAMFEVVKEKVFAKSWQWVGDKSVVDNKNVIFPITYLKGVLDEPLLITNDGEKLNCISNVCTHRGKILVEKPKRSSVIGCGYHGRCFSIDGKFKSMPEFEKTKDFPTKHDDLDAVPITEWLKMLFVSLNPKIDFEKTISPIMDRCSFLPLNTLKINESFSKTYNVKANWALYVDNYLEGFHVNFVHPALKEALDLKEYKYELFDHCNLQIGVAKDGEPCFDLPENHPDHGQNIYAYYYWVYPNMMINIYPWGLSMNHIQPLSHDETQVIFRSYEFEGTNFKFEDNNIDDTEMEDEAVVQSVQKGIQSRLYTHGRYSPTMEKCVHHFHRMIARDLS